MPPSPICTINGLTAAGGQNVTAGSTVTIQLVDLSAASWTLSVVGVDDTQSMPGPALTINNVARSATFTAPAAGTAVRLQSTVTDGQSKSYSATLEIYVLTSGGKRVIALGETTEGDATHGWVAQINAIIRGSLAGLASNVAAAATAASQGTASTSYVDLATAGPSVTLTTGTSVIVMIACLGYNTSASVPQYVSVAVSGATTLAASDSNAALIQNAVGGVNTQGVAIVPLTVTAGSNTFKLQYRTTANTGTFQQRGILVLAL